MSNDIWSLGIILLNLATGRNPWKSAAYSDPTFQAYVRDPLGFIPAVLPISAEANAILVRMLDLDWRRRMSIAELKIAIENIDSFYSPGAVFEGSMARCPWEVTSDIEQSASVQQSEAAPSAAQESPLASKFSADSTSEMIFASHPGTAESSYDMWQDNERVSTFGRSSSSETESESAEEDYENELDEFSRDLFARPITPSSVDSNTPSFPMTPEYSFRRPERPPTQRKPLTIDTAYLRPRYFQNDSHSASSYVTATEEDEGVTAVDTESFYYASREDMNEAPEVFEMDLEVSPSVWEFESDYLPVSRRASVVMGAAEDEDEDDTPPTSFPPSPMYDAADRRKTGSLSTPVSPARPAFHAPSPTTTRPRGMTMPSTHAVPTLPNQFPKPSPPSKPSLFRLFPSRGASPAPAEAGTSSSWATSGRAESPMPEQKRKSSWFPRPRLFSSAGFA